MHTYVITCLKTVISYSSCNGSCAICGEAALQSHVRKAFQISASILKTCSANIDSLWTWFMLSMEAFLTMALVSKLEDE